MKDYDMEIEARRRAFLKEKYWRLTIWRPSEFLRYEEKMLEKIERLSNVLEEAESECKFRKQDCFTCGYRVSEINPECFLSIGKKVLERYERTLENILKEVAGEE